MMTISIYDSHLILGKMIVLSKRIFRDIHMLIICIGALHAFATHFSNAFSFIHKYHSSQRITSSPLVASSMLRLSSPSVDSTNTAATEPKRDDKISVELQDEDWSVVSNLARFTGQELDDAVQASIPSMHPRLMVTLQKVVNNQFRDSIMKIASSIERYEQLEVVGHSLSRLLDTQLQSGKTLLNEFLDAGELRKLDSIIARAAKAGKLDMAFFSVLNMNIRDATVEANQLSDDEKKKLLTLVPPEAGGGASRLQILQHIYTRCQEEVEKNVNPGVALLNKLLRTDISSIRTNLLNHYLCPQGANVITTPDGRTVELQGQTRALISTEDFVDAISNAVMKIRTIEKAGGSDRVAAANLVENCRQVAIEARVAIFNAYGEESHELKAIEESLQKVFRPDSAQSKYMQGE